MILKTGDLRKELVRRAKQRMLNGEYNAVAATELSCTESLTDARVVKYADTVREIKSSEEFIGDPLKRLMDRDYYERLDESGKFRYILELSKIYCDLRQKI